MVWILSTCSDLAQERSCDFLILAKLLFRNRSKLQVSTLKRTPGPMNLSREVTCSSNIQEYNTNNSNIMPIIIRRRRRNSHHTTASNDLCRSSAQQAIEARGYLEPRPFLDRQARSLIRAAIQATVRVLQGCYKYYKACYKVNRGVEGLGISVGSEERTVIDACGDEIAVAVSAFFSKLLKHITVSTAWHNHRDILILESPSLQESFCLNLLCLERHRLYMHMSIPVLHFTG